MQHDVAQSHRKITKIRTRSTNGGDGVNRDSVLEQQNGTLGTVVASCIGIGGEGKEIAECELQKRQIGWKALRNHCEIAFQSLQISNDRFITCHMQCCPVVGGDNVSSGSIFQKQRNACWVVVTGCEVQRGDELEVG
jgi:hypothetical protein